jgi:hypothetical protein
MATYTAEINIPLAVQAYIQHRLEGDRCGEISPDLRQDWESVKTIRDFSREWLDWAEVVAEWDSERFTTDLDTEVERLRSIISLHWEQAEYGDCQVCGASAWVNPVGQCSDCDGSHTK